MPRAAEKTRNEMAAAPSRVGDRPQRKGQSDQRNRERRKPEERRTMQRALVMLMLTLRGRGRAVGMSEAEFKGRRRRGGDLNGDRPRQHGLEHERVGGEPADELPPQSPPLAPFRRHRTLPRVVAFWRVIQDTVQKIIA